ncbi:hypothetical protein D3C79_1048920 [compost metagenome]
MALDVLDKRYPVTVFISRHGKIGDEHVGIQFRQVVNQCCGIFKFADNIHPFDLFK